MCRARRKYSDMTLNEEMDGWSHDDVLDEWCYPFLRYRCKDGSRDTYSLGVGVDGTRVVVRRERGKEYESCTVRTTNPAPLGGTILNLAPSCEQPKVSYHLLRKKTRGSDVRHGCSHSSKQFRQNSDHSTVFDGLHAKACRLFST